LPIREKVAKPFAPPWLQRLGFEWLKWLKRAGLLSCIIGKVGTQEQSSLRSLGMELAKRYKEASAEFAMRHSELNHDEIEMTTMNLTDSSGL